MAHMVDFEITDLEIEKQEAIISHMGRMIEVNQDKITVNNSKISAMETSGNYTDDYVTWKDENRGCQRMIERLTAEINKDRLKLDGNPDISAETDEVKHDGWIAYLAKKKAAGEPAIIQVEDGMPL